MNYLIIIDFVVPSFLEIEIKVESLPTEEFPQTFTTSEKNNNKIKEKPISSHTNQRSIKYKH